MRLHVTFKNCELKIIEKETGCRDVHNYIRSRLEALAPRLPLIAPPCEDVRRSYLINNEQIIFHINEYCRLNGITPGMLIRRLVVDPILQQYLMGETLGV